MRLGHRFAALILIVWVASIQGQNLLSNFNPGFESGKGPWSLWIAPDAPEAMAVMTFPNSGAPAGTQYARVKVTSSALENWHIQLQTPPNWTADSGTTYRLSFLARSDSSSSFHLGVNDGPATNYTYRMGFDIYLTTSWVEQTIEYTSDASGVGSLRFNLYLGLAADTYEFDEFNLEAVPVGTRFRSAEPRPGLLVRRDAGDIIVTLREKISGGLKLEMLDLGGRTLSATFSRETGSLRLPGPAGSGVYLIRATTPARAWARRISF